MNDLMIKNRNRVKTICLVGLLIALSLILANFKIFQSIALDSMPAFLGAIIISPAMGGLIGVLGHFFSAMFSGFSLTLPMHFVIMVEMFIVIYIFGVLYEKGAKKSSVINEIIAVAVGIILNGPVSILISGLVAEFLGIMPTMQFVAMMIVPLTIAAVVNIVLAYSLGKVLKNANIKI